MTERRTARTRKTVDYSKFGCPDDFDDDFADLTPPAKKQKTSSKDTQKKLTTNQDKKRLTKRGPLAEKVYERELQEALEISLLDSQGSICGHDNDDDDFKPNNSKKLTVSKPSKIQSNRQETVKVAKKNEILCNVEVNEERKSDGFGFDKEQIDVAIKGEEKENTSIETQCGNHRIQQEIKIDKTDNGNESDGIVILDEEEEKRVDRGVRRRSAPNTQVNQEDSEEDADIESSSDEEDAESSDEDYDEQSDSDFDGGSKKLKKAENKKPAVLKQNKPGLKKQTAAITKLGPSLKTVMPNTVNKEPLSRPVVTPKQMTKPPVCRSTINSPVVRTVPKWNPPGSAGSVKSPSVPDSIKSPSGGMRLGLSRNQRVKSLHSVGTLKSS